MHTASDLSSAVVGQEARAAASRRRGFELATAPTVASPAGPRAGRLNNRAPLAQPTAAAWIVAGAQAYRSEGDGALRYARSPRKLEAAGFSPKQAQETAAALAERFGQDMLTRRDLSQAITYELRLASSTHGSGRRSGNRSTA